jgi:hypothetical protein
MTAAPLQFPEWQREYEAALFELSPAKLPQRAMISEFALLKRLYVPLRTIRTTKQNARRLKAHYPTCDG